MQKLKRAYIKIMLPINYFIGLTVIAFISGVQLSDFRHAERENVSIAHSVSTNLSSKNPTEDARKPRILESRFNVVGRILMPFALALFGVWKGRTLTVVRLIGQFHVFSLSLGRRLVFLVLLFGIFAVGYGICDHYINLPPDRVPAWIQFFGRFNEQP